jgi:hypothetical protein
MQYVEFLRARNVVVWYAIWALGVAALSVIISLFSPHATAIVIDDKTVTVARHGVANVPFVALWVASGLFAAIAATILGASLACENDGHLELAWTKPVSRLRYAVSKMLVDAGAIFTVQVFTLAVIIVGVLIQLRGAVHFGVGQSDLVDMVRFAMFPLAWYALLQGLTASLRGQAGIAQGLIWPISLGLTGITKANFGPVWAVIIGFPNLFNPLNYAHYAATSGTTTFQVMGADQVGFLGVLGLAGLIALGSGGALVQWRRLEA